MMTVEQRMTRQVITLTEDQTLRDAIAVMQRHRIRHVPVVAGRAVVGMLTDRDVKRATPSLLSGVGQEEYDRVLTRTRVGQVMTRNPFSVTPATHLKDAVKLLVDSKYGALPVVERNELVGIVTGTDLLRAFYEMLDE
ncbi:MAG TPA: CBS domain-containing protein [Candidatus Polarisedimenticolia bacterium]|nr:CBS domain-containing protein [Candidatus Polarisedimenticolia bacterium]